MKKIVLCMLILALAFISFSTESNNLAAPNKELFEKIIYNYDSTEVELVGNWTVGKNTPEVFGDRFIHDSKNLKGKKSVIFTPNLPPGNYKVSLTWPAHEQRSPQVPIIIHYAGGVKTVIVDQRINGGQWNEIGQFEFVGSPDERVTISNAGADGYVVADAIKFEQISSTVPTLISASPGDGVVNLHWLAVDGANGYVIKYGDESGAYSESITVGNVTNYTINDVNNDTTYYVVVSSLIDSEESTLSNELQATPSNVPKLGAPQNFSAIGIDSFSIELSWDAPAWDSSLEYTIIRDGDTEPLATTTDTNYTDNELDFATSYMYQVIASDEDGNVSGFSEASVGTTFDYMIPIGTYPPDFPEFVYDKVVIDPKNLKYKPTGEVDFPTVIKATDYFEAPLGKYYMYYGPHDSPGGIALAYADSLDGEWTEYENNPIISKDWEPHYNVSHVASAHPIWIEDEEKLFMYFHGENHETRYASSTDGITFEYEGMAVTTDDFHEISEASYARVFEYTIPAKNNKYIMLIMGNNKGTRRIYLAWSQDGRTWETQQTPIISPIAQDNLNHGGNISGAWYFPWEDKHFVSVHGSSGNHYMIEVGENFDQEFHYEANFKASSTSVHRSRVASRAFIEDDYGTLYMFYEIGPRGSTKIALAKVVSSEEPLKLNRVDISIENTTMEMGSSYAIDAKLERVNGDLIDINQATVQYFNTDSSVASIVDGVVHALQAGTTEIWMEVTFEGVIVASNKIIIEVQLAPIPDLEAPSVPRNVSGVADRKGAITLTWDAATDNVGVIGYKVYRDGDDEAIATVSETTYTDTGLEAATSYTYQVSAIDAASNESDLSAAIVVVTQEESEPGPDPVKPTTPAPLAPKHEMKEEDGALWLEVNDYVIMLEAHKVQGDVMSFDLSDIDLTAESQAVGIRLSRHALNTLNAHSKGIELLGNGLRLVIPAGSLNVDNDSDDIFIKITNTGNVAPLKDHIPATTTFDISIVSREQDVDFNGTVYVEFELDDVNDPNKLAVYYYNETLGIWEHVGGTYNAQTHTIGFEAEHFSKYGVFELAKNFKDVAANHWAYAAIYELARKQIITGTSDDTFRPEGQVTRAEFTAMLFRMLGLEKTTYSHAFADVKADAWYADILETAYRVGIIEGDGANMHPDTAIKRQEMAAMVMRVYEMFYDYQIEEIERTRFNDDHVISKWAIDAVGNAVQLGIIQGKPNNLFDPQGTATRAEAATIIHRMMNK